MNPRSILVLVQRFFSEGPSRKVLRRRLVALSVLPALLLLGFAVKLIVMVSTGYAAQSHYLAYDSYSLRDDVRILKSWNIIDSYKAYFTEGDRYVLEGRLAEAETEFKESLKRVDPPESCPVRINLEVVLETRGDLKSADHKRDDAKKFWEEALAVTREAPAGCFNTTSEPDEAVRKHLNETEQRLLDKLKTLLRRRPLPVPRHRLRRLRRKAVVVTAATVKAVVTAAMVKAVAMTTTTVSAAVIRMVNPIHYRASRPRRAQALGSLLRLRPRSGRTGFLPAARTVRTSFTPTRAIRRMCSSVPSRTRRPRVPIPNSLRRCAGWP